MAARSLECTIGYRDKAPVRRKFKFPLEQYFPAKSVFISPTENLRGLQKEVLPYASFEPTITYVVLKKTA